MFAQRLCPQSMLRIALILLAVLFVSSVGATPRYAYTANYFDSSISRYRVDADSGMLHHLGQIKTLKGPSSLVLHPSGKYLYVVSQVVDFIAIYAVDSISGELSEIKGSPVSSRVRSVWQMAVDPAGRFLYVPGRFTKDLVVFKIAADTGKLTPLTEKSLPTGGDRARFIEVAPDGKFVYVSNTFSNSVAGFRVSSDANIADEEKVVSIAGTPFKGGDAPERTMAHPNGKYLYLANWRSADVIAYNINPSTGVLTQQAGKPAETEGHFSFGGMVHPNGKYLFSVNWASSDISSFRINEKTGALSLLSDELVSTGGLGPLHFRIAPSGRLAYIPNYDDSSLSIFSIDPSSGELSNRRRMYTRPGVRQLALLEGEEAVRVQTQFAIVADAKQKTLNSFSVEAGQRDWRLKTSASLSAEPSHIAVTPQSDFVYVALKGQKAIETYRLNGRGQLTLLQDGKLRLPGNVASMFVEQNGRFLYTLTRDSNGYQAFAIDRDSGRLTLDQELMLRTDGAPDQIAMSPAGRYSFVLDKDANTLQAYRYLYADAPVMFELTRHGSPYGVGLDPTDMAIDPSGRFLLTSNAGDDSVSVELLPGRLGPITSLTKSRISTGKLPVDVAIHNNGRFVFVVNQKDNSISSLKMNPDSGRLSPNGPALPVGERPVSLEVDPSGQFAYLRYADRAGITRFTIDVARGRLTQPEEILAGVRPSALAFTAKIQ